MTALIRRLVTVDWPKGAERNAKAHLIRTARAGHQKIMAEAKSKGSVPAWEAYANTPSNKNLETVVLPGPIVYNYRYLNDLIEFALEELRRQSPFVSGDYRRGHTLYINNSPVTTIPKTFSQGDKIMIANPVPYARRLEVGKTKSGRPFVIQVQPRIYHRVAEMLESRAKGRAKISEGFVALGNSNLKNNQAKRDFTTGRMIVSRIQRKDRIAGAAITSPAIFITAPI